MSVVFHPSLHQYRSMVSARMPTSQYYAPAPTAYASAEAPEVDATEFEEFAPVMDMPQSKVCSFM